MASYETDEVWNKESVSNRRGYFSAVNLHKFTGLLRDNTVLLQRLHLCPRDDPIHELKRQALEEARVKLGLATVDQVRTRITLFRKFAAKKFRASASRFSAGAAPETILRCMPKWLRDLEPHLNLWQLPMSDDTTTTGGGGGEGSPVWVAAGEDAGGRLARALAARARALRTLEARVVATRVGSLPQHTQNELHFIWWRMLDVVRQKLSLLCAGGGWGGAGGGGEELVRLTGAEPLLAELVLLYDDSINTLPDTEDVKGMQALVGLFHVAQQFRLEEEPSAAAWTRAHTVYINRPPKLKGFCASRLLMQRRWHALKGAARRAMLRYAREGGPPPCPLHASIAKRFPHVVTAPWRSWRNVVHTSGVVDPHEEWTGREEGAAAAGSCAYQALDVAADDPEGEGEDDLVVVEREIETIDLEGEPTPAGDTLHDTQHEQDMAAELEMDLDRQLARLPAERGGLFAHEPSGPPTFIYDSDDDDDHQDRQKNMESIASRICSEVGDQISCDDDDDGGGGDDAVMSGDDEESGAIDEKLLMVACVPLSRVDVDAGALWRRAAAGGTINVRHLLHTYPPSHKRIKIEPSDTQDQHTHIKQEKIEHDPVSHGRGERQVKSVARRLIAEMMRDADVDPTRPGQGGKKVQLPDIDEVRKNNKALLTAQVAPLAPPPHNNTDPTGDGRGGGGGGGGGGGSEAALSREQLDQLLEQLTQQRGSGGSVYCCPSREQHAAAAKRPAPHHQRDMPARCSACAALGGACSCCCAHLWARAPAQEARAKLRRETSELAAALTHLATHTAHPETQVIFTERPKKRSYKEKKQGVTPPATPSDDPLQEWIRQKNLNQQYFNLNLKTPAPAPPKAPAPPPAPPAPTPPVAPPPSTSKFLTIVPMAPGTAIAPIEVEVPPPPPPPPSHVNVCAVASASALTRKAPPDFRKFLLIPADGDPRVKTKVVFANNNPVRRPAPGPEPGRRSLLLNGSVDGVPSFASTLMTRNPKTHAKLYTAMKGRVVAKQLAGGSSKLVVGPSRTLPGNRLVRLSAAPTLLNSAVPAGPPRVFGGTGVVRLAPKPAPSGPKLAPLAPKPAPADAGCMRGTGMEVTKILSSKTAGSGGARGPRSLLRETPPDTTNIDLSTSAAVNKQLVKTCVGQKILNNQKVISIQTGQKVISKPTDQKVVRKLTDQKVISIQTGQKVISTSSDQNLRRLTDGAVLTKMSPEKGSTSPADDDDAAPNYFGNDSAVMTLTAFESGGLRLLVQVADRGAPPLMVGALSYLLTERALHAAHPAFWTLTHPPTRLVSKSNTLFPPLELVDNKYHLPLQDEPRLYAKVFWVVHTVAQCLSELSSGASLFVTSPRGSLTPLRLDQLNELQCDDKEAVQRLSVILSEGRSKAASNARARAALQHNNERRRPLELVQLSDDDDKHEVNIKQEPNLKTEDRFNGLERFEDMEDFDL